MQSVSRLTGPGAAADGAPALSADTNLERAMGIEPT